MLFRSVQAPDVSLGTLIAQNQGAALTQPWLFFYSAAALILFALAANLLGDGLRDAFDPTSRAGKRLKKNRRNGRRNNPGQPPMTANTTDPAPEPVGAR